MVPIVRRERRTGRRRYPGPSRAPWRPRPRSQPLSRSIGNRGYYPIRVSDEEYRHMTEEEDAVDKRFKQVMMEGTERWIYDGRRQAQGEGPPRDRLPGERRHVRDRPHPPERPTSWRWGARNPSTSRGSTMFSWAGRTRRRGTRSASCPTTSSASGWTPSSRRSPDPKHHPQLPRAAVRLGHRRGAGAGRRHEHQGGRQGHATGRLEVDPAAKSAYNPCWGCMATSTRARARTPAGEDASCSTPAARTRRACCRGRSMTLDPKKKKVKNYVLVNGFDPAVEGR